MSTDAPALVVSVAGERWAVIEAPIDFAGRDWLLGVVAVQAFWSPGSGLSARVRAHRTGDAQARERPLGPGEAVAIWIGSDPDRAVAAVAAGGASAAVAAAPAGLTALRGRDLFARADLPDAAGTPLRAFGHVFVRWRRDAPPETGVDLTGFTPPDSGDMFGRLRSEPLPPGVLVTYLVTCPGDWGGASA